MVLLAAHGRVTELLTPADVATFLTANPDAPLVVDARFEPQVAPLLPAGYHVLGATTALPESRRLLLIGRTPRPPAAPIAATAAPRLH